MFAEALVYLMAAYAAAGLIFAVAFVIAGVQRVDHQAQDAPIGFRLIILPGAAALWPALLMRWIHAKSGGAS